MRFYDRVRSAPRFLTPVNTHLSVVVKFETISHFLSPREPPPSMLLDRTDEEDGMTLPSPTTRKHQDPSLRRPCINPWKAGLHGYGGIILEVMESSQVVTVMLF